MGEEQMELSIGEISPGCLGVCFVQTIRTEYCPMFELKDASVFDPKKRESGIGGYLDFRK